MIDCNDNDSIGRIVKTIANEFDIDILNYEFLRKSENLVYKLETKDGKFYALRIRRIVEDYETKLLSELEFLCDMSGGVSFEVPLPVKTKDDLLYTKIKNNDEEYACVVFSWVSGEHCSIGAASFGIIKSLAESTALFHNFSKTYKPSDKFIRNTYGLDWYFGEGSWSKNKDFTNLIDSQYIANLINFNKTIEERLRKIPNCKNNFGLVHYDLMIGNFKFNGNKANMLDFDELGWGYYLFDLAHLLFGFIKNDNYELIKNIIINRYSDINKDLNISEYDLKTFVGLQCIAYMNWLYRLYWRDNNLKPLERWIPEIVSRINILNL